MRTVAVVLAGGTGQRFGGNAPDGGGESAPGGSAVAAGGAGGPGPGGSAGREVGQPPKQLLSLSGRSLLERAVAAFDAAPGVAEVLVVIAAGYAERAARLLGTGRYGKLGGIIEGGLARADSTRRAIGELSARGGGDCNVLFHDAARPLVEQRIIADCVAALADWQAVGVVVPASDTVVEVTGGVLTRVLPRQSLARCQTPQGFRLSVIARAYELAAADPGFDPAAATDDCGVVLRYLPDVPVRAVPGSERNIKITYPVDLDVAEALLRGAG
jgi:2-C-methyl-D-erythritol 4-phosphate cytidylyltransferase